MKKNLLASAVALSVLTMAPGLALAKDKESGSNGAANGQPFQTLQAQIDANAELITANDAALTDLQGQIDSLGDRVSAVESSIVDLEADISGNAASISAALAQISSNEENVEGLSASLAALAEQHTFDIGLINELLAGIQTELVELNTAREALASALAAQLASLGEAVDSNAVAIDSLLLSLVTINAELTSLNSNILSLTQRQDALETTSDEYADLLADLGGQIASLESAVATLQGYHLTTFSGIQTNVPLADLSGWSICYSTPYRDGTHPENIIAACTGSKIMLACRPTGSNTLTLAAYANRNEVFLDTGDRNNIVHTANGVDWYLSGNYSMGFAPVGAGVRRSSADVAGFGDGQRLSWHTHDGGVGGYRCGDSGGLNGSNAWEKLVLQAD